jgi:tape measure domain-containing protein
MSDFQYTVGGDFSQILRGFEQLENRAQQAGQGIGRQLSEGINESSLRSLNALTARLARLQQQQARIAVDSTEFAEAERQIREVQGLIAAINRRRVTINADPGSIVALRAQLDALNARLGEVAIGSRSFRQLQREIAGVERELRKAGDAGGVAARGVNLASAAYAALGGIGVGLAITGFFRSSIQQAIELETATRRLTNTLGPQGAGGALSFVRGISDELGLSFRSLVGSYGRFTAAATAANVPIAQQEALFKAVSRAGMALGLSNDEVNGALLALQQIASKGTVSMEELRQQLGERLPIALAATARGLGMSTKELIKLVETGQLSANRFFPAFTKGLNELTAGAQGMPTAAQNLQRFTNEWEKLQVAFGQNLLPGITESVKNLTEVLKGAATAGKAASLGLTNRGFLGGTDTQSAQIIGELDRVQQKFNLTDQQAKNIFSEAFAASGGKRNFFGGIILDAKTVDGILANLETRAKRFREGQGPDRVTETNAQASALTALQGRLDEQVKKEKELNALAGQRTAISTLEAEAALTQKVAAGKATQAEADKALNDSRRRALQDEIRGLDEILAKQKEAKASGAAEGSDKNILATQSARAQKVLELAKIEQEASRNEVEKRQRILELAQGRLELSRQAIDLENRSAELTARRLQDAQRVGDAQLALAQALQGLTDSQFSVDHARQGFALRTAEEELQAMRDRGAGAAAIAQQEQNIASLKRGAADLERRQLEASIAAAAQRFALERQVLQLKQAQAVIEAQNAQRAAQANVLEQRQKVLGIQGQLADPSITGAQRQALQGQLDLQQRSVGLAQQQATAAGNYLQTLGAIQGLERQTLQAQQQTTANGFRAQAAAQGFEQAVGGGLANLDQAARGANSVAAGAEKISAGFISAGGQTIQIQGAIEGIAGLTSSAAGAAGALAAGYSDANTQAQALLSTLRDISATPQARWAGGPVDPSVAYRVNELGQESLLTPGGALSLISAPARGMWRPPTRGTVLPAGVTATLKARGAFGAAPMAAGRAGGGDALGKLEQAIGELRIEMQALRQKDWGVQVRLPGNAGILGAIGGF